MKEYILNYYTNFKCIANKCKHTCCAGWEADIDKTTLEGYKTENSAYEWKFLPLRLLFRRRGAERFHLQFSGIVAYHGRHAAFTAHHDALDHGLPADISSLFFLPHRHFFSPAKTYVSAKRAHAVHAARRLASALLSAKHPNVLYNKTAPCRGAVMPFRFRIFS